jgi:hypothetical protein
LASPVLSLITDTLLIDCYPESARATAGRVKRHPAPNSSDRSDPRSWRFRPGGPPIACTYAGRHGKGRINGPLVL